MHAFLTRKTKVQLVYFMFHLIGNAMQLSEHITQGSCSSQVCLFCAPL